MKEKEVFKAYYKKEKAKLDQQIEDYNKKFVQDDNEIIKENLEYFKSLNSDGKNIRGILVKLGYNLVKDDTEYSDKLALAYEVFQTGILVHDDIIDKDKKRRGKDTIHYLNYQKYKPYSKTEKELSHFTNSIAICMGDYGLYSANKIISDNYQDNPNLGKVLSYFNSTVLNTIKGELLDVVLPFQSKNAKIKSSLLEESILNIYRLKTSHYTIIGPLSTGLILAGADNDKIKDITEFGERVGIAFQIQDDILGIYSENMGKVKGSDIKEFKQTILYSHIMTTSYKEEFLKYYGQDNLSDETIERVKELLELSGSLEYATDRMNKMYQESIQILEKMDWINPSKKEILKGFVEYLKSRNK